MTILAFMEWLRANSKRYVIFDVDETLLTLHIDWPAWGEAIEQLFLSYDKNYTGSAYSGWAEAENDFMQRFGAEFRKKLIATSYRLEKQTFSGFTPNTTCIALCKAVAKSYPIGIWTSNDKRTVANPLREVGVFSLADSIVTRNEVNFLKPDPDGFRFFKKPEFSASDYVMIGDSQADKGAAKQAGISFFHVSAFTL